MSIGFHGQSMSNVSVDCKSYYLRFQHIHCKGGCEFDFQHELGFRAK
jgi:hypothetical protein